MDIIIRKRPTKRHGLAFDLDYRWRGERYKPLLGYNLSKEEATRRAVDVIQKIQQGSPATARGTAPSPTLRDVLPLYWQTCISNDASRCVGRNRSSTRTSCRASATGRSLRSPQKMACATSPTD
jgi:hypothetical protein